MAALTDCSLCVGIEKAIIPSGILSVTISRDVGCKLYKVLHSSLLGSEKFEREEKEGNPMNKKGKTN